MSTRKALAVVAGLVLVLGFVLALIPTSVAGGEVTCGTALSAKTEGAVGTEFGDVLEDIYAGRDSSGNADYDAQCGDRIFTQRIIAFPIAAAGALALLFLLLTQAPAREEPTTRP